MIVNSRGFTLPELLIVIAMVGILIGITLPLGRHWIIGANISSVEGELSIAVGKAKSAAIRNQFSVVENEPVTAICLSVDQILTVLESTVDTLPSCSDGTGNEVWRSNLSDNVQLSINNTSLQCMCFSSMGTLTDNNCAACQTDGRLTLTAGSKSETIFIN